MNLCGTYIKRDLGKDGDLAVSLAQPFGPKGWGRRLRQRREGLGRKDRVHSKAESSRSRDRSI